MDRDLPTRKQSQDYHVENAGYDTLRTPKMSLDNKPLLLGKDMNSCLSPTDSPLPLCHVPSPCHVLIHDQTTAGEMTREMGHGCHRKTPNTFASGLASVSPHHQNDSPFYEMPDEFIDIGQTHRLKPPGSSTPPALPERGNLNKKAKMSGGLELPPAANISPAPQLKESGPAAPCTTLPTHDLEPTKELVFYGQQREEESGEKRELKEFASYPEMRKVDKKQGERAPTPDDNISVVYVNVKKVPKDEEVAAGLQMSRKESVQSEPPEIPP